MSTHNNNKESDKVSEAPAPYGKPRRMAGKRIVVTEEERLHMDPPCPAEPEWMDELDAEADRREALRAKQK